MNVRTMRGYEGGEDYGDSNHRDRTLRALEGRRFDDASQITPPDSAGDRPDGDDSGDLFLKIAREDTLRRNADNNGDSQSAIVSQPIVCPLNCFKRHTIAKASIHIS